MVRRRLGCWVVIAVLVAGCATPDSNQPPASDKTDVWFMRHMAGHLLQTTSILHLTSDRITRPKLTRLATTINQQGQAHLAQLQAWLASRGLAPYEDSLRDRSTVVVVPADEVTGARVVPARAGADGVVRRGVLWRSLYPRLVVDTRAGSLLFEVPGARAKAAKITETFGRQPS